MLCIQCKIETKNPKFCSSSCSTTYNNIARKTGRKPSENKCLICNNFIFSNRTYCKTCWKTFGEESKSIVKIKMWLDNSWRGGSDRKLSEIIRNHLLKMANFSCSSCGFNKMHPDDGKPVLEINHIDGNGTNHRPENLEVLCPNCHALTSSYRGRNYGNGRPIFYQRVVK